MKMYLVREISNEHVVSVCLKLVALSNISSEWDENTRKKSDDFTEQKTLVTQSYKSELEYSSS